MQVILFHPLKSKSIINIIAISSIFILDFLFILKYAVIYTNSPFIILSAFLILFVLFLTLITKVDTRNIESFDKTTIWILASLVVLVSIIYILFVPRFGQIGRLPAIKDWLSLLFTGNFPYNSNLAPSSFPALFFIAIPFYFVNHIGLLEPLGLVLFLFVLIKLHKTKKEIISQIVFLFGSPILFYEFVVRSELFFNVALVIFLIYFAEKNLNIEKRNFNFYFFAFLFGVGLSTRSIVAVIYIIYFIYKFRSNLFALFLFGVVVFLTFALILIPFIYKDYSAFIHNGPFAVQSNVSQLPMWIVIIFLIVSVYSGWIVENLREVFFTSGVSLFLLVIISYIIKISEFGFKIAFFHDKIDLSYLVFCFPFLILSIGRIKAKKFIGILLEDN